MSTLCCDDETCKECQLFDTNIDDCIRTILHALRRGNNSDFNDVYTTIVQKQLSQVSQLVQLTQKQILIIKEALRFFIDHTDHADDADDANTAWASLPS